MNKLIVSDNKELTLKDTDASLEIKTKEFHLAISGNVSISEINYHGCEKMNITVFPDSSLTFNKFSRDKNLNLEIDVFQKDNSKFRFNYSVIAIDKSILKINGKIEGHNNESSINIRGVTEQGSLLIEVVGIVSPNTFGNRAEENIKCLVLNENECEVIPSMLISSDEIVASHNVSIGGVPKNDIFYLKGKGLSEEKCIKLIKDGFILNNLNVSNEEFIKIKEKINWR